MNEDSDPPMIVRATGANGFIRCNASFRMKVGFDGAELAKKPFVEWIAARDQSLVCRVLEGSQESCQVRHNTKDGGAILLDIRITDQGEEPIVLVVRPRSSASYSGNSRSSKLSHNRPVK